MRESRFLCLAVSRRDGGNCIAGIDIDSGAWIRPVNPTNRGALWDSQIVVEDRKTQKLRIMAPLDLINLRLNEAAGISGQPENWTLPPASDSNHHSFICCATEDRALVTRIKDLADADSCFSQIFGTADNKVPHSTFENAAIKGSLCVVRPNNLTWVRTTDFNQQPRIDARFEFGVLDARYYLRLTDIAWEPKLLEYTRRKPAVAASELPDTDATKEILLTISLGDHFKKTGFHYKLVAGVLVVPRR
jgi:hypothetical protein